MKIEIHEFNNTLIAEIVTDNIVICNSQDALNIIANCNVKGARNIMIHSNNIVPDFFDLKTGLAGDVLQKFSNYKTRIAIVGDFSKYSSQSLTDFMNESNRMGNIVFVSSIEEAQKYLLK